ncbi:hypothetical protein BJV82DRAFT_627234 [Fennellomyces sp. T-0311]|nr:hypothetical protein BJV82DRAFT_627234 [Fennellomyces sp. T-0311]
MPNSSHSTYTTMMRVTRDGRPYCQDLNDLFAALVIQHGLRDHRYRFRTIPASFVFIEGIEVLGHLQFTHVMRTPDPADPSRVIATRTVTTFTMAPKMARTLGQHFCASRLVENAIDPANHNLRDKAIYIMTPKSKFFIQDFSQRAQVSIKHMEAGLSRIDSFNIVRLERLPQHDDQLAFSRPNMTLAFKTMMAYMPMESLLADDAGGIDKKDLDEYRYTFFGYQAFEWIMEYTTVVTREEAEMVAAEFVLYGWIHQVLDKSDRDNSHRDDSVTFKMGRTTIYYVTLRGRTVLGWDRLLDEKVQRQTSNSHDSIVLKQRALAARLKHGEKPTVPSISSRKMPPPSQTDAASTTSSAASTAPSTGSSSYSIDSQNPSTSDDSSTEAMSNGFENLEGIEYPMLAASDNEVPKLPTQHSTDIDEVTERLLQLRSTHHPPMVRTKSTDGNPYEPSPEKDFITCMPLDSLPSDPNSSWAKLRLILEDPLLRMYFREFKKSHFCEENVNIWVDYYNIRRKCKRGNVPTKEILRDAYALYDTYIAPDANLEVNIEHGLRQEIIVYVATHFTVYANDGQQTQPSNVPFVVTALHHQQRQVTVIVNGSTTQCLKGLLRMYDLVIQHICRIMAQDSVPKFIRTEKYREIMANPPAPVRRNSVERH